MKEKEKGVKEREEGIVDTHTQAEGNTRKKKHMKKIGR